MAFLTPQSRIFIAGHRGLVGSSLIRCFRNAAFSNLLTCSRHELDLTSRDAVWFFFEKNHPEYVVIAAAKVGGIAANMTSPVDFLVDNLEIQNNLLLACKDFEVTKTLFLGSSCIYPRESPQPMQERYLMHGPLEPTNESYAIAKIAGIQLARALNMQFKLNVICPIPCNVYGPGDHFEFERSHVISALVRRFEEAKRNRASKLTLWGTGAARREFLHVDDLSDACLFLLKNYDSPDIINVGSGVDYTIRDLALIIADLVGFSGELEWDHTKPDGMPRKLLDIQKLSSLGWRHRIDLKTGIRSVIADFKNRFPA